VSGNSALVLTGPKRGRGLAEDGTPPFADCPGSVFLISGSGKWLTNDGASLPSLEVFLAEIGERGPGDGISFPISAEAGNPISELCPT